MKPYTQITLASNIEKMALAKVIYSLCVTWFEQFEGEDEPIELALIEIDEADWNKWRLSEGWLSPTFCVCYASR